MANLLSGYITLDDQRLHYVRMGTGRKVLLAFHGYGNDASLFIPFRSHLEQEYTIVSIDLPYHGRSEWADGIPLSKARLVLLVDILKEEFNVDKVSLMGYSLGGRVCLTVVEQIPASVDKVLLIASDGLVVNKFYYTVTRTKLGSKVFRFILDKPSRYVGFIEWLKDRKWIDASRYRFIMHHLRDEVNREFLLNVWPSLSPLIPNIRRLKKNIANFEIPVFIFMGRHDRVLPPALAERFKKGVDNIQLHILDKGHRVFDTDTLPQMAACLLA